MSRSPDPVQPPMPQSGAHTSWTDEELLAAMRPWVCDGRAPTRKQWDATPGMPRSALLIARIGNGAGWPGVWEHLEAIVPFNREPLGHDEAIRLIHAYVDENGRLPCFLTRVGPQGASAWRLIRALHSDSWSHALDIAMATHPRREQFRGHGANGARYSDAQLRAAMKQFAAEHDGPLNWPAWETWAAGVPGRPRLAVLKRRFGDAAITAVTGLKVDKSRAEHRRELAVRRERARGTLRELAGLLGRTPRRAELNPERLASHPRLEVRRAATETQWLTAEQILDAYGNSWGSALTDAGLQPLDVREEVQLALIDYRERFGIWPANSDLALDRARRHPRSYSLRAERYRQWGGPCKATIELHFGTVTAANEAARDRRPDLARADEHAHRPYQRARARPMSGLGAHQRDVLRMTLDSPDVMAGAIFQRYGRNEGRRLLSSLAQRGLVEPDGPQADTPIRVAPGALSAVRDLLRPDR